MTGVTFSRGDVQALADKLMTLALTDLEQQLLLAIFAAAGYHVTLEGQGQAATSSGLCDQIVNSFVPESGGKFLIHPNRIGP